MRRFAVGALAVLAFLFVLLQYLFHVDVVGTVAGWLSEMGLSRPELSGNVGYGVLVLFGLLTSVHCVGMCGPILFSASNNLIFQAGRVLSYGLTGLLLGGLGSLITVGTRFRAVVPIVSGTILVVLATTVVVTGKELPLPASFMKIFQRFKKGDSAFLGLLMGFMPCGSLQMAQAYALGTGSALTGMLSMFCFAVGTVPTLLLFGSLFETARRQKWTWVLPLSAILMLVLGVQMIVRGITLFQA